MRVSLSDEKGKALGGFTAFNPAWLQLILLVLALFYAFYGLDRHELLAWDESWYGVNAKEMERSGDPLNYYYGGEMDDWNSKPPLSIYLIHLSFRIFGHNEFALRIPSALSSVLFFLIAFRMVRRYKGEWIAFFSCLILMGGTAIYGEHVARTGDTDMLFTLFMAAAVNFVTIYDHAGRSPALLGAGGMLALAFLTKSLASLLFLPAIFLFLLLRKTLIPVLKNRYFCAGAVVYLLTVGTWIALVLSYGNTFTESAQGGRNAIENMFFYDTYSRLTVAEFAEVNPYKFDFVLTVPDSKLNLWNYLFYAVVIGGISLEKLKGLEVAQIIRSPCNKGYTHRLGRS